MRVRPTRNITTRRTDRGAHPVHRTGPQATAAADHPQERRARESGGPIDNAHYSCSCGLLFEAAVSTTVSCPHCGAQQAW